MGLNSFSVNFSSLTEDVYLRVDEKFYSFLKMYDWNLFSSNKELVEFKDILVPDFNLFEFDNSEFYKGVPTGQDYLDGDGFIIGTQLVSADNCPNRLKYKISNDNLLISSLRLAKSPALYFENEDLSEHIFSNGFYVFKVKSGWNIKYILYVLRTKVLKNILDNHIYRGIGISAYKMEDLLRIKIPRISIDKQNEAVEKIKPIERRIINLREQIHYPQDIINKIISAEFNFNLSGIIKIANSKYSKLDNTFTYRNSNIRLSVGWNKICPIQKWLYKKNPYIKKLGNYIKETKNGWSPFCRETDSKNYIFNLNSISKNGIMNYDDLKTSDEVKKDIEVYFAKEGDLFVSRGNTVDLVALASVIKGLKFDNIIFPDLFIRVELKGEEILKEYLALLFNSIIGRLYFKYSAKGKNQTMVKISSDELNNFYLPIPPRRLQEKIVADIYTKFSQEDDIREKIGAERILIDEIIKETNQG